METHAHMTAEESTPSPERLEGAADDIERRLSEHGLRRTPQRRAVLRTLLGAAGCVTAAQVHADARRVSPELGLMTVYRTLDILVQIGVVRRVHGCQRCEAFVSAGRRHGHTVVCTSCGRAAEFTDCHLEAVAAAAASETGFAIAEHFLQFNGVCRECQLRRQADRMADDARNGRSTA